MWPWLRAGKKQLKQHSSQYGWALARPVQPGHIVDYTTALKIASRGTLNAVFTDRGRWMALLHDLGEVLFGLMVGLVRIGILLLYPVSTPILACIFVRAERRREHLAEDTARDVIKKVSSPA